MDIELGAARPGGRAAGDGPARQFVVKLHSRCDLECSYCYVYSMSDRSWLRQPRSMSRQTVAQSAKRIAEYAHGHALEPVEVVLHGGEPLLAGRELIEYAVRTIRTALGPGHRAVFSVQTNAVLLDDSFLDLFDRIGVGVGVSLDGDAAAHDAHRRHPDGRGSHAQVAAALERLCAPDRRHLFNGLLCVIDVRTDPVHVYESLAAYDPPAADFLLPHGSWAVPPPGLAVGRRGGPGKSAPYGEWLVGVFDHWYGGTRSGTRVRLLEEIINLLLGGTSATEEIGGGEAGSLVIATDGAILPSDALAAVLPTAGDGDPAAATRLQPPQQQQRQPTVWDTSFDAFARMPAIRALRAARARLCRTCRACPVGRVCGGGQFVHRYREENGFDNPSVYCADLYRLIEHVRERVAGDVARLRAVTP